MKRVSATKRGTPSSKKSKQKSITSFFASRTTTPVASHSKPDLPASSPSTSRLSQPSPRPSTSRDNVPAANVVQQHTPLRRTLFTDDKARLTKRRRVVLDDSDDDDDIALTLPDNHHVDRPPAPTPSPSAAESFDKFASPRNVSPARGGRSDHVSQPAQVNPPASEDPLPPSPGPCDPSSDRGFDFDILRRDAVPAPTLPSGTSLPPLLPVVAAQRTAVRDKLMNLAAAPQVGQEDGGWCERHPWATNIRDSKKRRPGEPGYDKTTLYIPPSELNERRGTKDGGLSPFQRQFWSIKMMNYDVIIFFKKGKFYELYDVDADVGHSELGLNFTKGGRVDMRCCGVPEQSFEKHCSLLIDLGYKVGRVEQTETANAAEKRKIGSGNKASVCERSLVRILTKATVREEGLLRDHRARYVFAVTEDLSLSSDIPDSQSTIVEDVKETSALPQKRTVGVCFVDVASGKIDIRQFQDDARLSRTERLIAFLAPQQIVADLSASSKELANIITWTTRQCGIPVDDLGHKKGFEPMTEHLLANYLDTESSPAESRDQFNRVCAHMDKYKISCRAFGGLVSHLKALIIDKETLSLGNYTLDPSPDIETSDVEMEKAAEAASLSAQRLRMDASTLQNLEILSSSLTGNEKKSLLSFVDQARTPAGRRLLRKWVAEPLVSSVDIEDRLQAVEDVHMIEDHDGGRALKSIIKQLKTKKDLERALPKLHQFATVADGAVMFDDTNKRRVKEFVHVLRSVQSSLHGLESLAEVMEKTQPKSDRLKWLCTMGQAVPGDAIDKLDYFLGNAFNIDVAENEGEIAPKRGAIPSYDEARDALDDVERQLEQELTAWKSKLNDKSIKYYHRGKEPYQIEVRTATLKLGIPNEFELSSESKTAKRFYTNRVKRLVRDQVEASETYDEVSSSVAREMVRRFDQDYATWASLSRACAEVDAFIGLAMASRNEGSGPMCRPTILPNSHADPTFCARGLRHPILAAQCESFVANDVTLGGQGNDPEVMILTGPNAGGKSTLARQVGLCVVLAQIGCFVPAESVTLRPFADVFVRMGATDDLARGRSTFMVEMEEVSNILNNATERSLIIADEVGRGTSTHDGYAVAHASLDYMRRTNRALTIFSTHYSHLGEEAEAICARESESEGKSVQRAGVYEMGAVVDEKNKRITFLYKLRRGASTHSRGIYCARVAGIGESVGDEAERAAKAFDDKLAQDLQAMRIKTLCAGLAGKDAERFLPQFKAWH